MRILAIQSFFMNPYTILTAILVYFLLLISISFFTTRKADNQSFFLGNRRSPWYLVAFGMIGASLSGVTFISVPGWVLTSKFFYMQMILGYLLGYAVIIHVLLPIYYKQNLTTIYTFLLNRFGNVSYKTGAYFFLISRIIGSSFRLFLVASVLQLTVFNQLQVPFVITVCITLILIYIYTFKGGIKTIVYTDTLQTFFLLGSVILTIIAISRNLNLNIGSLITTIAQDPRSQVFDFENWRSNSFFLKQFFSGAFITIVMTGLDQDMMQKNLSCKSLKDAQKNMYWYSALLVPVNLLFLSLGLLLAIYCQQIGVELPKNSDDLYPMLATGGYMPHSLGIIFIIGLIAAAYSSADSALTALTTSFTIDVLNAGSLPENRMKKLRMRVHILMSVVIGVVIILFKLLNNEAVISSLFKAAGYTYGPLLGLFSFGVFSKRKLKEKWVPVIALLAPVISFLLSSYSETLLFGYKFGFEILMVNGLLTYLGLWIVSVKKVST